MRLFCNNHNECRIVGKMPKTNVQILRPLVGLGYKDKERYWTGTWTGTHRNVGACLFVVTQVWRHARSHDVTGLAVDPAGNSVLHTSNKINTVSTGISGSGTQLTLFPPCSVIHRYTGRLGSMNQIHSHASQGWKNAWTSWTDPRAGGSSAKSGPRLLCTFFCAPGWSYSWFRVTHVPIVWILGLLVSVRVTSIEARSNCEEACVRSAKSRVWSVLLKLSREGRKIRK
jgi:hypothetical protein